MNSTRRDFLLRSGLVTLGGSGLIVSACGGGKSQASDVVVRAVTVSGGTVELADRAKVTLPPNSLDMPTDVRITSTNVPRDYSSISPIYGPVVTSGYRIAVNVGMASVIGESVTVTFPVSKSFIDSLPSGYGPEVFVSVRQSEGSPIDSWELVGSKYDVAKGQIAVDVPGCVFDNSSVADAGNEVNILLGSSLGSHVDGTFADITTRAGGTCKATSIGNPLATMVVQEPFGELRNTGGNNPRYRLHWGADLTANGDDPILSAGKGWVEFIGYKNGYEKTIVVLHQSGVRTLYAHLNSFEVPTGNGTSRILKVDDEVNLGDQIATGVKKTANAAGTGVIPHLHFELAASGGIFEKKNKINPIACTGNEVSGAIEFGDNGSVADDSFTLTITPVTGGGADSGTSRVFGPSAAGQRSYPVAINNLRVGRYRLDLLCNLAPDNVGTYFVRLNDNVKFETGDSSERSDVLDQGETLTEYIVVYSTDSRTRSFTTPIPVNPSVEGRSLD